MITELNFEIAPIDETTDVIIDYMKDFFFKNEANDVFDPEIEVKLSKFIDEKLKSELYCIIEYPYVDKVYRDSYYSYFSSKHNNYFRDCIRVSIFNNELKKDEILKSKSLQDKYLGFFIIRPLKSAFFGRALISPTAFKENNQKLCLYKSSSVVLGHELTVKGFPHSSQDGETISCAETTIWGLMDYFGNKYPEYSPTLPSRIIKSLKSLSIQRQLPSNGLTVNQISYALKEFGFGTRIYSALSHGKEELYNIIDSYIESGIPIVIGVESDNFGHAFLCIGKSYSENDWEKVKKKIINIQGVDINYFDSSDLGDKYVVQDDNLNPYELITLDKPGCNYEEGTEENMEYEIDAIVVPLYPKIYLEVVVAKELTLTLLKDSTFGFNFGENFVFRMLLASSRSFKKHILDSNIEDGLKFKILSLKMPKFIWCAEFYTQEQYGKEAIGLIILDATEANNLSIDALIFAGYPDYCISMSGNNFVTLDYIFSKYSYFSNLK